MGSKQKRKRERNKRARKRDRRDDAEGPNSFTYGPASFVQEGKAVMVSVDRDHPTYEAFHATQKRQIDETPELTLRLREEIAELAAPFHAFDVNPVAHLFIARNAERLRVRAAEKDVANVLRGPWEPIGAHRP